MSEEQKGGRNAELEEMLSAELEEMLNRTPVVVMMARDLVLQLLNDWSPPVRVKIIPPTVDGGNFELIAERVHESE